MIHTQVLQKVSPEEHACKFYRLQLLQEDDGSYSLIQEWGRIGQPGHQIKTAYPTEADAQKQRDKLFKMKQKRGYALLPGQTEIPATFEALPCPWCQLLQPGQARHVATLTHSALYLNASEVGPVLLFVYRHHIPSLSHLDAASLLGFLAEIRRVQSQAKDFLQAHLHAPWVQLFGGSEHLWCQLGPLPASIEVFALQGQHAPTPEVMAALRQVVTLAATTHTNQAETEPQHPGQLSLLDLL